MRLYYNMRMWSLIDHFQICIYSQIHFSEVVLQMKTNITNMYWIISLLVTQIWFQHDESWNFRVKTWFSLSAKSLCEHMCPHCKYWMSASSQGLCSTCSPVQCWPPLLGAGLSQLRVLDLWCPEQDPQEDQQLQLPWITPERDKELLIAALSC